MNPIREFEASMELCARLKEQIESDCCVGTNELGGRTLSAYENARKSHLLDIKKIYTRLLTLRSAMDKNV